jgi:galactose mutarotase-like enzyme
MVKDATRIISISSEFISAKISNFGAELKSLKDLSFDLEYVYQGDTKYWERSAPILFPIVGKLKDDRYLLGNKYYSMPNHGFARDNEFEVVEEQKDKVTFRLGYNVETLKMYPFKFILEITYRVIGPKLHTEIHVFNVDKQEIYFSFGLHPAFNIPLREGSLEDYYIEFEEREPKGAYFLDNGHVNFEHQDDRTIFDGRRIPLSEKLFANDALIFKDFISSRVLLKNKLDAREVIVTTNGCPYLGIWKKPDAPFVCIEPWHGVADSLKSDGDFFKKEGIIVLESNKSFDSEIIIQVN